MTAFELFDTLTSLLACKYQGLSPLLMPYQRQVSISRSLGQDEGHTHQMTFRVSQPFLAITEPKLWTLNLILCMYVCMSTG